MKPPTIKIINLICTITFTIFFCVFGIITSSPVICLAGLSIAIVKYLDSTQMLRDIDEITKGHEAIRSSMDKWHDNTKKNAAKFCIGETIYAKALIEVDKDPENRAKYIDRWLTKRDELLAEIDKECEARDNQNLDVVYLSALEISEEIIDGKLDINRD